MKKTINLDYVKEEQNKFLNHLKTIEGIKCPKNDFDVPKWLVLSLICELVEVINESKSKGVKWWDKEPIDEYKLKKELSDLLSHIGNVSNFLDIDLKLESELPKIRDIRPHLLGMIGDFTTLGFSKYYARNKLKLILQKYFQLIDYFGYDIEDIKEVYLKKMKNNYARFDK
ncbi:MAG: dUTP diphosphatase [Cetobacterium sp.]